MKQNIIHIGLDVDDTQYHGSALDKNTGEVLNFKCRPTLKGLVGQLKKLHKYFPENSSNVLIGNYFWSGRTICFSYMLSRIF